MKYKFNEKRQKAVKKHDHIKYSSSLIFGTGSTYSLSSVINHIGEETNAGHYNIVIFDDEHKKFVLLDDTVIVNDVKINTYMNQSSYIFTYEYCSAGPVPEM